MNILLADDQNKVRFALRVLLEQKPGIKIVEEATSAGEVMARLRQACPDLVILDWNLPGLDIASVLEMLHQYCPHTYVIALSEREETQPLALASGVDAFACKTNSPERLLSLIEDYAHRQSA